MNKYRCVALIVLAALAACQPAPQPAPSASPTVLPTLTASPSATVTASPTATVAPTVTPTLVPTATPTTQPTSTPTATPSLQVQVNSPDVGYLNVRDAPSTSGALVMPAKDGTTLDVIEPTNTAKAKIGQPGQWLKVRTPDGKEGFAAAWYLSLPGASPTPAPSSPDLGGGALELFNRTNALRAQNGLAPLQFDTRLAAAAERHSQDMAGLGNIDHVGSDGSKPSQRIRDTGYMAQVTGENIYGGVATVDDAWNFWANDPLHRAVLLNPQYAEVGIGIVKAKAGWYYFTMDLARLVAR